MGIYDFLGCSFIMQGVEKKGGGVFLSSKLESIQVAYYSKTCPAVVPQKTKYSHEGQPLERWPSSPAPLDDLIQLLPKNDT